jgi:hypothetical protein
VVGRMKSYDILLTGALTIRRFTCVIFAVNMRMICHFDRPF